MLSLLPFVAALATAPAPAASPSPPPTKLQEIGRVRTSVCTSILVHANGAITQALDNDRDLAIVTANLRATNFDGLSSLQRRNSIDSLMTRTQAVRTNFKAADNEIKMLREMAKASNDAERKAELKAFADALGGALERQKKAAEAFDSAIVILRGREDAFEARGIMNRDRRLASSGMIPEYKLQQAEAMQAAVAPSPPPRDGEWNKVMHDIAQGLDERVGTIAYDEGVAADHSIAATTGC